MTGCQTLLDEGSSRGEVLYRHKDGHEIWADVHSRLIRTEDGEVEGVIATFRDIREQKDAQQALTWEAARLRTIVEAAPVGLGIVAADGEVLTRNDVLRKIWAGEAPVHSIDEFEAYKAFWPETGEQLMPEDWPAAQALKHGRSVADMVVDIERFDGTRGTIVLSTAPIEDDGTVLGAVTIVQDITSIRENERALRFLTDEVRALHETVVLDRSLTSTELARDVVAQADALLGSDGSSIFLLSERRIPAPRRRRRRARPGERRRPDRPGDRREDRGPAPPAAAGGGGERVSRGRPARRPTGDPRRGPAARGRPRSRCTTRTSSSERWPSRTRTGARSTTAASASRGPSPIRPHSRSRTPG